MATQKEALQTLFEVAGTQDIDAARSTFEGWRDRAATADQWNEANNQLNEICAAFGVTDHTEAIARINALRTEVGAIHTELGAADQASAIAAIHALRDAGTNFQRRIGELETSQADFDTRVNQEVINRAASAGIAQPVKKDAAGAATGGVPHNLMARADFEALPPGQRMKFIQSGGRLTD